MIRPIKEDVAVFGPLAASEPDNPELITFLVRILLQFVKIGIFKPNLATSKVLYFVTLRDGHAGDA